MSSDPEREELIEGYIEQHFPDDPVKAQRWRDSFKYWALDANEELIGFDDVMAWAEYRAAKGDSGGSEPIEQDYVVGPDNETYFVSTVLIGLDMGLPSIDAAPLIFETMIFRMLDPPEWMELFGRRILNDREDVGYQRRYPSLAAARAGHEQARAAVLNGNLEDDDES